MPLRSTRSLLTLLFCGVALLAAFRFAPAAALNEFFDGLDSPVVLEQSTGRALVEFWGSGDADPSLHFGDLLSYWTWWHVIKAVICVGLLAVLVMSVAGLWQRYIRSSRRGSSWWGVSAATVSLLGIGMVVVLLANIQSAAVPLVSLLQLLPGTATESQIAPTIAEISAALALEPSQHQAAVPTLLAEAARYHWVLAACSSLGVLCAGLAAVRCSIARSRATQSAIRYRRSMLTSAVICALLTVALLGVVAISAISALDPTAAVLDIL